MIGRPQYSGKLTRDQVVAIVARYNAGETLRAIAGDYPVTHSAIAYQVAKHTVLKRDQPIGHDCGSRAGYRRHKRLGSKPCDPCREAHNAAVRASLARKKEVTHA